MNPIKNRSQIDERKILIFGAGKIGRSFIGQLFGKSGYKVVFVDTDQKIVERLNNYRSYRVIIKGVKEEEIIVQNVKAILASDEKKVIEAISLAGILAVSVGRNAIEKVIPILASGLKLRYRKNPDYPLNIIIAENMREGGNFIKVRLKRNLPLDYPIEKMVGLVETSIGKMVPYMSLAELERDPLMIYAEPYNTLIIDRKGFKSPIPDIKGLAPKDNIKAWVDRKAFIHNLGHATAAYYGYYRNPNAVYMWEILEDRDIFRFTRDVMFQSANILRAAYPSDFTAEDLEDQIDNLINRFMNKALKDTIFRVGHDLIRKLKFDDRFMGVIHLAINLGLPYDKILKAMSYGLFFKAKDEEGNYSPLDIVFLEALSKEFEQTLLDSLELDPQSDLFIIKELKKHYKVLRMNLCSDIKNY